MTSFHDLPDDILAETLSNLPALSILSCRKTCRKLDQLSKVRHVWMAAFHRTQYMLRQTLDLTDIPLAKLEISMVRAEKINQTWSDEAALRAAHPRLYRLQNSEQREPLTVVGDYIIFRKRWDQKTRYQWISKHHVTGENIVLDYVVPDGMIDSAHYMDHASGIFYLFYCPRPTKELVHIVEIKVDDKHGAPRVSTHSQVRLNGDRLIEYMQVDDRFVYLYIYNPDFDLEAPSTSVDILDFRKQAATEIYLPHPPSFPEYPSSKTIQVSDAYIMLVVNCQYFSIFHRQSLENESNSTPDSPTQPEIYFSGTFPSIFRNGGCLVPGPSFAIIGFGEDNYPFQSPSKIYLLSFEGPEVEDSIKTEFIELFGSTRRQTLFVPPSSQTRYTLGMSSTTKFSRQGTMWVKEDVHYYALRFDVFGPKRTLTVDGLKAIKMDPTSWLGEGEGAVHVVDFDPFSGTALLAGPPAPEIERGFQTILVLEYSNIA